MTINRRTFLLTCAASIGCSRRQTQKAPRGKTIVSLVDFNDSGDRKGIVMSEKVVKTPEEWKDQLTPRNTALPQEEHGVRFSVNTTISTRTALSLHLLRERAVRLGATIPDGLAQFWRPSLKEYRSRNRQHFGCAARKFSARSAMPIWGTSSMTARTQPTCAIASTRSR